MFRTLVVMSYLFLVSCLLFLNYYYCILFLFYYLIKLKARIFARSWPGMRPKGAAPAKAHLSMAHAYFQAPITLAQRPHPGLFQPVWHAGPAASPSFASACLSHGPTTVFSFPGLLVALLECQVTCQLGLLHLRVPASLFAQGYPLPSPTDTPSASLSIFFSRATDSRMACRPHFFSSPARTAHHPTFPSSWPSCIFLLTHVPAISRLYLCIPATCFTSAPATSQPRALPQLLCMVGD